jgi:hypothetical protein
MVDVVKFCPGAIYGARGWTAVVRMLKNGKPVGSKTRVEPFATRADAVAHAVHASHDVMLSLRPAFAATTSFVVAVVPPPPEMPPAAPRKALDDLTCSDPIPWAPIEKRPSIPFAAIGRGHVFAKVMP